jgi:hypothetical protein
MRGSSAFQVEFRNFSVWRVAVSAIVCAVVAALLAWWSGDTPAFLLRSMAAPAGIGLALCLAMGLWRVPAGVLAWDGGRWHFTAARGEGDQPMSGTLELRLDLGVWMLVRFVCDDATCGPRVYWLPAQKGRAADPTWHRLRCAIYSPQSRATGGDTSARSRLS